MDPLKILPEEIRDEILSHLTIQDIKQASLVSKDWYNIIGQSKLCMRMLRIRKYKDFEDFESILNSNRQYQSLTFLTKHSELKKSTKFLRVLRDIVEKFSQSLLCLQISHDLKLKVDLPKLKELQFLVWSFESIPASLIVSNGLITKAKHLKKLIIRYQKLDSKSPKYLKDALKENESLKILEIFDVNIIKKLNLDDMKLKLDEFHLMEFSFLIRNKKVIQDFLNTQATSLQVAKCPFNKEFISYFMSSLPKLHTLIFTSDPNIFHQDHDTRIDEPDYPLNEAITKLFFRFNLCMDTLHTLHTSAIINKMPNLQEIQVCQLTPPILPLVYNCPSLKFVKYSYLSYEFTQTQKDEIERHERIKFTKVRWV